MARTSDVLMMNEMIYEIEVYKDNRKCVITNANKKTEIKNTATEKSNHSLVNNYSNLNHRGNIRNSRSYNNKNDRISSSNSNNINNINSKNNSSNNNNNNKTTTTTTTTNNNNKDTTTSINTITTIDNDHSTSIINNNSNNKNNNNSNKNENNSNDAIINSNTTTKRNISTVPTTTITNNSNNKNNTNNNNNNNKSSGRKYIQNNSSYINKSNTKTTTNDSTNKSKNNYNKSDPLETKNRNITRKPCTNKKYKSSYNNQKSTKIVVDSNCKNKNNRTDTYKSHKNNAKNCYKSNKSKNNDNYIDCNEKNCDSNPTTSNKATVTDRKENNNNEKQSNNKNSNCNSNPNKSNTDNCNIGKNNKNNEINERKPVHLIDRRVEDLHTAIRHGADNKVICEKVKNLHKAMSQYGILQDDCLTLLKKMNNNWVDSTKKFTRNRGWRMHDGNEMICENARGKFGEEVDAITQILMDVMSIPPAIGSDFPSFEELTTQVSDIRRRLIDIGLSVEAENSYILREIERKLTNEDFQKWVNSVGDDITRRKVTTLVDWLDCETKLRRKEQGNLRSPAKRDVIASYTRNMTSYGAPTLLSNNCETGRSGGRFQNIRISD